MVVTTAQHVQDEVRAFIPETIAEQVLDFPGAYACGKLIRLGKSLC